MEVRKSDGSYEQYDKRKLTNVIKKVYKGAEIESTPEIINSIISSLYLYDGILCSSIRKQLEEQFSSIDQKLLDTYRAVKNKEIETEHFVEEKKKFIEKYKKASNTANATVDDNSNVGNRNVAVLSVESQKAMNIQVSRGMIVDKLKEICPDFNSKNYIKDLKSHIIYKNDESSFAGAIAPYTYSSKEVVEVLYNGENLLVPLELLYDMVNSPEILVDSDNEVYQKLPWYLFVKDKDNKYTQVTHITKKRRHKDLVRVKTAFGEDIVVTEDHPMIVDIDNINNTIPALDSLGKTQYKINTSIKFKGKTELDLVKVLPSWVEYGDKYILTPGGGNMKRFIKLDRDFGYIVGFFIGDGGYENTNHYLSLSQKDKTVLEDINNKMFDVFGLTSKINTERDQHSEDPKAVKYVYSIRNHYIFELFKNYFKIQDKAQNKTLPINILEFNEEFAKGILEGLIDSDGTIKSEDCTINIRLSSRAGILQCTELFRYFGYSIGNSMQSTPFSNNGSYKTNYTIWGINATKRETSVNLDKSFKVATKLRESKSSSLKYHKDGTCTITSIDKIEEESSFLIQNEYIYDLTTETHTFGLNNILVHNCVSITMYPFLTSGLKNLGGLSAAPKNIDSFCGMFCNLVFAISSQFAGAVAVPEVLVAFNYFSEKEWGSDYYLRADEVISKGTAREKTIRKQIHQYFQQIIYTINQPAAARGFQSAFVNFSYFDEGFFNGMFGDFYFPDGTKPNWESVKWLQKEFMMWFNAERLKCILTFPVESVTLLFKDGKFQDEDMFNFVCEEYARGHSFFTYISDSVDSLSSCCRLKNKIQTKEFNFTNGNIGVMTGSKSVISFNLSRIIQDWYCNEYKVERGVKPTEKFDETKYDSLKKYITKILERVYKYHLAYNELLWDMYDARLLPAYSAGFIDLNKQYLTMGLNGLNQAAEFLGFTCNDNPEYSRFCQEIFGLFKEQNELHKVKEGPHKLTFNTEQVPAESLAIKNYNWDKEDGYWVPEDTNLYASYVYKPNDDTTSVLEKIKLMGSNYIGEALDGGSAAHINLSEHLTKEQYKSLLEYAAKVGCTYLTFNIPNSECEDCGFITKTPISECPHCGSKKINYYDRVIGYLTKIKNWSDGRQIEQKTRIYDTLNDE